MIKFLIVDIDLVVLEIVDLDDLNDGDDVVVVVVG